MPGVGVPGALSQDHERMHSFVGCGDGGPGMHMQEFCRAMEVERREFERTLEEIDATPEQEEKLWKIRGKFLNGVSPIILGFLDTLDDFDKLPTIDRDAAEKLRAEVVKVVDKVSRKLTRALLDGRDVLTPEQLKELLLEELLEQDRSWHPLVSFVQAQFRSEQTNEHGGPGSHRRRPCPPC
ncbi:Spy/CpxP family protein refolding chaperone [Mesorhizobium kowhaii]|uniref:Spy/CpxP family protein refolding chaperone n=1 Tax=Mesorhizobium kowhaii TaxID=1300272 RepID=UPI000DAE5966|nr:Spy/CpxP family protein refolding chaperone [Mesorhizobium kowhaii]